MSTGDGGARDGRPSRRGLLTAGLAAAAVAGTGAWRTAPAGPGPTGPGRAAGLRQHPAAWLGQPSARAGDRRRTGDRRQRLARPGL